ncbi:MAG TPA: hypothetical protein VFB95_13545 [Candidatus Cryosericum sp.]|nr:hypothetical protein [Candidatus Cryosericum sp.]
MSALKRRFEAEAGRILEERIARFRKSLEEALRPLGLPLDLPHQDSGPDPDEAPLEGARAILDTVARGGRQREILLALLQAASTCYRRTAIFIVRGDTLVFWSGRGFESDEETGAAAPAHVTLPARGDHLLARALTSRSLQHAPPEGPGFVLTEALGGTAPHQACALPLLVRGQPVAILYGDTAGSTAQPADVAFDVVGRLGALALGSIAGPARRTQAASGAPARMVAESSRRAVGGGDAAFASSTITPPEEAEMQALLGDLDRPPRRETADSGETPESRRQHTDARRFASLLVSELLLYNEEAVILGRKNRDLARRLGKEIERSRQAYAARISKHLGGASRYLEEEMVRVLADGDPALLRH